MEDNNSSTPALTVISGGRDATNKAGERRSGKAVTGNGLTEKQQRFVEGLLAGLTNSEAYRQAYDCSRMQPNTVHSEASKLAANPKVAACLEAQLMDKRRERAERNSMESLKVADRVWRNVWRLAEGGNGVPPAVQQSALALAAKMAGMLTDKVEIEQRNTDSSTIEKELFERLQRLSKAG